MSRSLGRHFKEQRVGDVLEAFCQLLRQVHQVFRVASEMEDFDDCSLEIFTSYFLRLQGEPPLAGQPLRLEAIWGDLRGLLGVQEAQVRTGLQGLLRRVRADQILAMPDGAAVPDWLTDASNDRVPWGPYPDASGRTLLVTAERYINRFSMPLYESLLCHPLGSGAAGLLKAAGENWLVASWPFLVLGGPKSFPLWGIVDGRPLHCYVCRDVDRPEYALYGTGDAADHAPISLDGTGRRTAPRPRVIWRLAETSRGMRPRLVVRVPANEPEEAVSIRHGGEMMEDDLIIWEAAQSAALSLPPEGELTLHYRATGRIECVPFRFAVPMAFIPSEEPGNWLPITPAEELPFYERTLHLVGAADTNWQIRGFTLTRFGPLESPWQEYGVWLLERQARVRLLRIGTMSRTWWETEARAALSLTAAGTSDSRNDLLLYRDPEQVRLNVRGYLGRHASDEQLPLAHHSRCHRATRDHYHDRSRVRLVRQIGRTAGPVRPLAVGAAGVTVSLQTPAGVDRREPGTLSFCSIPQLTARNEPILRPDSTSVTFEVAVAPGTRLEYQAGPGHEWTRVVVEGGLARIECPASDALRADGTARLPLRVEGIPFRDALTVRVKATGLAVIMDGREQFLGSSGAKAQVDLKDDPILQPRELLPGESVCITDAEDGRKMARWGAGQPPVELSTLDLHSSQAELRAWLITVDGAAQFPLGTLTAEWTPTITALDAVVGGEGIEVSIEGNLPTDKGLVLKQA